MALVADRNVKKGSTGTSHDVSPVKSDTSKKMHKLQPLNNSTKALEADFNSLFLTGVDMDADQIESGVSVETAPSIERRSRTVSDSLVYPKELERRPKTSVGSGDPSAVETSIAKSLEGLPGRLSLSPMETKKYFGEAARTDLFERQRYLNRQLRITHTKPGQRTSSLYFDNTPKSSLITDYAFAPCRPQEEGEDDAQTRGDDTHGFECDDDTFLHPMYAPPRHVDILTITGESQFDSSASVLTDNFSCTGGGDGQSVYTSDDFEQFSRDRFKSSGAATVSLPSSPPRKPGRLQRLERARDYAEFDSDTNSVDSLDCSFMLPRNKGKESLAGGGVDVSFNGDAEPIFDTGGLSSAPRTIHSSVGTASSVLLEELERPLSPRTAYLAGCARLNLNPRPSLIIRKRFAKELNLDHQGMGDQMAIVLSESLRCLPYIQSIRLADNNLTDVGMGPILSSILSKPNLLELNLSSNIIGPESAKALAMYLSAEKCPLQRLLLADADVDDYECSNFVEAMKTNKELKEMDLAKNKIGIAENLNTVYPDLITGGEALADLLRHSDCHIETLKLGWNLLRLDGAVDFVSSLGVNNTLTYLDLSYNALGKAAGVVLGDSIIDNKSLQTLKLCNNGLHACAIFTICQGIIENHSLRRVALDGNPIGEQGARALMMIPVFAGSRCVCTAEHCNLSIKDPDCGSFNLANPCDMHSLRLDVPFDRAKAFALLRVVATHQTFVMPKCVYEGPASKSGKGRTEVLDIVQIVSTEKEKFLDERFRPKIELLRKLIAVGKDPTSALARFDAFDTDRAGELQFRQFHQLLGQLGLSMTLSQVSEIIARYDVDGSGMISKAEFRQYLQSQLDNSEAKLRDLIEDPILALGTTSPTPYSKNERYIPPRAGTLHMTILDGFVRKKLYKAVSENDRDHIYSVAKSSSDPVSMITFSVQNVRIRLEEAIHLYDVVYKETRNKIRSLTMLLPYMMDYNEAKQFVSKTTDDDRVELQQIKMGLGLILKPIFGQPDGYYSLDMSKPLDVLCLCRLLEISTMASVRRVIENQNLCRIGGPMATVKIGDRSQHGNWTCFRNELKDGLSFEITTESCTPLPTRGVYEFDFCVGSFLDIIRPNTEPEEETETAPAVTPAGAGTKAGADKADTASKPAGKGSKKKPSSKTKAVPVPLAFQEGIAPLPDRRFLRIMTNCCLLKQEDYKVALGKLFRMQTSGEKCLVTTGYSTSNGSKLHQRGDKDARQLFDRMEGFYNSLKLRSEAQMKAARLEEIKIDYTNPHAAFLNAGGAAEAQDEQFDSQFEAMEKFAALIGIAPVGQPAAFALDGDGDGALGGAIGEAKLSPASSPKKGGKKTGGKSGVNSEQDAAVRARAATLRAGAMAEEKARIAGIMYCFDEGDEDLADLVQAERDFADHDKSPCFTPMMGLSRAGTAVDLFASPVPSGGAVGGAVNALSSVPGPSSGHAHTGSKLGQKRLLQVQVERKRLAKELELSSKAAASNRSIAINKLTVVLSHATDPEVIDDAERQLAILKKQRVDLRRINFKKLLYSQQVSVYAKAARVVEVLEDVLNRVYVSCRQLALLVDSFPQGNLWKCPVYGTYRVELIVAVFCRILDYHNLELVLDKLDVNEQACLYCRLGWFNMFNPLKCEGYILLNLGRNMEDRQFAKVFVALSLIEPGINWKHASFRWSMDEPSMPGWELTQVWTVDSTMPVKGIVAFEYFSGNHNREDECKPDIRFRRALCMLTSSKETLMLPEHDRFDASVKASYYDSSNSTNGRLNSTMLMEERPAIWVDYMLKQTAVGALAIDMTEDTSEQPPTKGKGKGKGKGKKKK